MPSYDLPLAQLRELRLDEPAPADLADFWVDTMARYPRAPTVSRREKVDNGLRLSQTWDLSFPGYGDEPIHAWLQVPTGTSKPLPTVVQFYGYSWTRPIPLASPWVEAGYAHLHLESRGQGWSSASLHDLTPDWGEDTGATGGGLMTRGVQSPETYYYRRLITDAVRLVQLAGTLVEVNPDRVLLLGGSQGGGVSIAVAAICALIGTPVAGAMPDVPFLCSIRRAVELASKGPYPEIVGYLHARPHEGSQVFRTLAYFDGAHLAALARCPALFSVALLDPICPPSTVFQSFNAWGNPDKAIEVYPWNEHEGGRDIQLWTQIQWSNQRFRD